ncbi:hypothetical protein E4U38_008189 [Claviceps purpurea]|nr:hypothetical protein E4U38_008189 [Claviceps purpurea]
MANLVRAILANARSRFSRLFVPLSQSHSSTKPAPRPQFLDEEIYKNRDYHPVSLGDTFDSKRYTILRKLGYGRYSTVWLASDSKCQRYVALKLLRVGCYDGPHPIFEREILEKIQKVSRDSSHEGRKHILPLIEHFSHRGPNGNHVCLTFDVLGHHLNLQAVNNLKGQNILLELETPNNTVSDYLESVPPRMIKDQDGVSIPLEEDIKMPHVSNMESLHVRIIDFGVASWREKHLFEKIQPLALRAPEVAVGASWDTGVDIWTLGCLTIEFLHGLIIFPTSAPKKGTWTDEDEHLARIIEVLGPFPSSLLKKGRLSAEFFDEKGKLIRDPCYKRSSLECMLNGRVYPHNRPSGMSKNEFAVFVDFLKGMLEIDPVKRKSAAELLKHEWLS